MNINMNINKQEIIENICYTELGRDMGTSMLLCFTL